MSDSVQFAKKYVEDILSFYGLNLDVSAAVEGEVIKLAVPSSPMNAALIGSNADTLLSIQGLTSAALRNKGLEPNRVNLDIADYKKEREHKLRGRALAWVKEVLDSGKDKPLEPMNSADRRILHQLADEHGLKTESVGEGKERHIVLKGK